MSVVYKDREEPRSYTTVRRYRVPEHDFQEEDTYEQQIVIKRDREAAPRYERDVEYRVREAPREVIRFPREERAPSPPEPRVREYRFERDFERDATRREAYDLEKYTRSTEYYQPQPIIIRQDPQPIIIKESPRQPIVLQRDESHYEGDVRDDRQMVRREPRRDDDDYYYERTTRAVDRGPRRGGGGEEFDERDYRRDVKPRDSASNYDERYSSDEDVLIVRKERDASPHFRRHLAEGAIAGLGAAEIVRHHRRRQGEEPGHRGRNLIGGAALGAVGAEALSRAKSRLRSSRSRSRSSSRSHRSSRRERRKHRSKSRSRSRARTLARLGTVVAVGALAGYALKNRGNKDKTVIVPDTRRSRSRRRRSSVSSMPPSVDTRARSESKSRDPENRNRRIAQAGLASAAAAGIWDRMRSRSRHGKSRSKSRIRTGVPIAAAGLGGAAVAGLYERNKARKEAPLDDYPEPRHRSRTHSRSRSRSAPYPDDDHHLRRPASDPALIQYGDDPIYPERHRDEPGEYRRRRRGSSASSSPVRRRHSRSSRSRSRSRSRTRGLAETAAAAGVAGVAAHEVTKRNERKRAEKERRRREEEEDMYAHDPPYSPPPMGANAPYPPTPENQEFYPATNSFPPPPTDDYGRHADYPPQEYPPYNPADYPPPPGAASQSRGRHDDHFDTPDRDLGYPSANDTFAGDTRYAPDHRGRRSPENVSATHVTPGAVFDAQDPVADGLNNPRKSVQFNVPNSEGMNSPEAPKISKNRTADTDTDDYETDDYNDKDRTRTRSDLSSDGTTETEHKRRRRRRRHHHDEGDDQDHDHHRRHRRHKSHDRSSSRRPDPPQRLDSPDSSASDHTVELPPRFDSEGKKMPERGEDPIADKIEDLLSGKGFAGGLLKKITGEFLGDGDSKRRR